MYYNRAEVEDMQGKTLIKIEATEDTIDFFTEDGLHYLMFHSQDCCESVTIDDINGDLNDLLNTPLLISEEVSSEELTSDYDSCTWTFYKFATVKGYVNVKWYGTSNGYYSESVDFRLINDNDNEEED